MKNTIGILAHVDAGKTTFSEQLLYHTKSIRIRGRVDHKDSFLDNHKVERERGITIFAHQGVFELDNSTYYLLDTPGHIDFSCEMERAIEVMDYAIIIVSAVEGIQGHTKTVWTLLRKYNVPTIFFINKLDRVGADKNRVINEIKRDLSTDVFYVDKDFIVDKENTMLTNKYYIKLNKELIEFISEYDDKLLEAYFEENYNSTLWIKKMKELIKENKIFPCFAGSALQDEGIIEFLKALNVLTESDYDNSGEFSGRIYKILHDDNGNRITFIKALSGKLKVRDEVKYSINCNNSLDKIAEKISSIRIYNGNKFKNVDEIEAGDLFAVTGLSKALPGNSIGQLEKNINYEMVPSLMSKVIFDNSYNIREILKFFKILESEDPSLNVVWNETFKEIHIHIMGKIQLEVLKEIVKERFNLEVEFGPCKIIYKETIEKETIGRGHFEPLRHYAEVHLKIEPLPRNSGIIFENKCHTDDLTVGNQNLIKTHIFEREHHGILTGSSITDMKITLLTGRAHLKHTCGGDFREATFRAIRQGLEKVDNVLLEPYYKFTIEASSEHIGKILSDIQKLSGTFNSPQIIEDRVIINGRGPVKTLMDYSSEVVAFTKGKGIITLIYDGYDICHNSEEVIKELEYNKNADIEYTSTSVFCSHGHGYLVPWNESDKAMHIQFEK